MCGCSCRKPKRAFLCTYLRVAPLNSKELPGKQAWASAVTVIKGNWCMCISYLISVWIHNCSLDLSQCSSSEGERKEFLVKGTADKTSSIMTQIYNVISSNTAHRKMTLISRMGAGLPHQLLTHCLKALPHVLYCAEARSVLCRGPNNNNTLKCMELKHTRQTTNIIWQCR